MKEEIKKGKGRPPSWKDFDLWSIRVPKKATSTIRAVAHAIDDGIVTEAQVMEWIASQKN